MGSLANATQSSLQSVNGYKFDMSKLTLAFIGDSNWDIYVDANDKLYAVGKEECRGKDGSNMDSHFGDKEHVKRLMQKGYFNDEPTEAGLSLMSGLCSMQYRPTNSKPFTTLQWA